MTEIECRLDDAIAAGGELVSLGLLSFPTGEIVASDPYRAADARPFARTVAPGDYALELGRVDTQPFGPRVAFARLRLRTDLAVVRHELATVGSADRGAYPVDSGLGSLMDDRARKDFVSAMERYYDSNPDGNYQGDVLARELKRSSADPDEPDDPGSWAIHRPPGTDSEIAVFASGLGDGAYESFWGLSESGEAVTLVTDFGLVPRHEA
jgi:hypothetical protein